MHSLLLWVLFNAVVLSLLFLDLKVFHRRSHAIGIREALLGSAFWISLALVFGVGVYFFRGTEPALKFFAGYLIEESLSVDNLFVFLVIFSYFKVPAAFQHRVLFWGILGALVMRGFFIAAGVSLIHRFEWMMYLFGAFLVFTGFKLFQKKEEEIEPEKNLALKLVRRLMPVSENYEGDRFFIRRDRRTFATPLFIVLLVVETTDILFAVDSIPAVLSVSTDPFIVYTSNIFAILGLRSLYFALAGLMGMFDYLHYGLGVILVFVGIKMLVADIYHVPIGLALGVIAGVLALSVLLSIIRKK